MTRSLPESVEVCGAEYPIRSDFRAIIDICAALNDPELGDIDRGVALLTIFYPAYESEEMPPAHYDEAIQQCFWFIRGGTEERDNKNPQLVDWDQDFEFIVPPVNRVLGREVRNPEQSTHWWTFLSAYREIGDCLFAQIVSIRDKLAKRKKLDKSEQEFYRQNRDIIDLKTTYTEKEDELLKAWGGK